MWNKSVWVMQNVFNAMSTSRESSVLKQCILVSAKTDVQNITNSSQPRKQEEGTLYLSDSIVQAVMRKLSRYLFCHKDHKLLRLNKIKNDDSYLWVVVEGGGCSGFQYQFELSKDITKDDRVFERDGAKIVVDKDSSHFI